MQETIALLRGQLEQAHIVLNVVYEENLPPVDADKAQLKQLFLNLCMNAIEAMKSGGRLDIRVSTRSVDDKRLLYVAISDTGPGIPPQLLEKIFDPFVTTKLQGSGLGLSICRGIAEFRISTAARQTERQRIKPPRSDLVLADGKRRNLCERERNETRAGRVGEDLRWIKAIDPCRRASA